MKRTELRVRGLVSGHVGGERDTRPDSTMPVKLTREPSHQRLPYDT